MAHHSDHMAEAYEGIRTRSRMLRNTLAASDEAGRQLIPDDQLLGEPDLPLSSHEGRQRAYSSSSARERIGTNSTQAQNTTTTSETAATTAHYSEQHIADILNTLAALKQLPEQITSIRQDLKATKSAIQHFQVATRTRMDDLEIKLKDRIENREALYEEQYSFDMISDEGGDNNLMEEIDQKYFRIAKNEAELPDTIPQELGILLQQLARTTAPGELYPTPAIAARQADFFRKNLEVRRSSVPAAGDTITGGLGLFVKAAGNTIKQGTKIIVQGVIKKLANNISDDTLPITDDIGVHLTTADDEQHSWQAYINTGFPYSEGTLMSGRTTAANLQLQHGIITAVTDIDPGTELLIEEVTGHTFNAEVVDRVRQLITLAEAVASSKGTVLDRQRLSKAQAIAQAEPFITTASIWERRGESGYAELAQALCVVTGSYTEALLEGESGMLGWEMDERKKGYVMHQTASILQRLCGYAALRARYVFKQGDRKSLYSTASTWIRRLQKPYKSGIDYPNPKSDYTHEDLLSDEEPRVSQSRLSLQPKTVDEELPNTKDEGYITVTRHKTRKNNKGQADTETEASAYESGTINHTWNKYKMQAVNGEYDSLKPFYNVSAPGTMSLPRSLTNSDTKFKINDDSWTIIDHINNIILQCSGANVDHYTLVNALYSGTGMDKVQQKVVLQAQAAHPESDVWRMRNRNAPRKDIIEWGEKIVQWLINKYYAKPTTNSLLAKLRSLKLRAPSIYYLHEMVNEMEIIWNQLPSNERHDHKIDDLIRDAVKVNTAVKTTAERALLDMEYNTFTEKLRKNQPLNAQYDQDEMGLWVKGTKDYKKEQDEDNEKRKQKNLSTGNVRYYSEEADAMTATITTSHEHSPTLDYLCSICGFPHKQNLCHLANPSGHGINMELLASFDVETRDRRIEGIMKAGILKNATMEEKSAFTNKLHSLIAKSSPEQRAAYRDQFFADKRPVRRNFTPAWAAGGGRGNTNQRNYGTQRGRGQPQQSGDVRNRENNSGNVLLMTMEDIQSLQAKDMPQENTPFIPFQEQMPALHRTIYIKTELHIPSAVEAQEMIRANQAGQVGVRVTNHIRESSKERLALADSGADITTIAAKVVEELQLPRYKRDRILKMSGAVEDMKFQLAEYVVVIAILHGVLEETGEAVTFKMFLQAEVSQKSALDVILGMDTLARVKGVIDTDESSITFFKPKKVRIDAIETTQIMQAIQQAEKNDTDDQEQMQL